MSGITIDREVLERALEVLTDNREDIDRTESDRYMELCYDRAITALREALAQPQQEPVAWMLEWTYDGEERGSRLYDDERHCRAAAEMDGGVCSPLYTSPPARKPLTGEQILDAYKKAPVDIDCYFSDLHKFARAIEAAHGIKDTPC